MHPSDGPPVNFFIIGQPKCGTTSLHAMLSQHPSICMSNPKEPNFFGQPVSSWNTLHRYARHFEHYNHETIVGDASPSYLNAPGAAKRMFDYCPHARLIAIFREPIDFIYSYYTHFTREVACLRETARTFETALELESARRKGKHIPPHHVAPRILFYSDHVKYASLLQTFIDLFGFKNILVVIYEDYRTDNIEILTKICKFLDIEPIDFQLQSLNQSVAVRSSLAQRLFDLISSNNNSAVQTLKAPLKALLPAQSRATIKSIVRQRVVLKSPSKILPATKKNLQSRFRPEVEQFGELIGRDMLRYWGYDS